MKVLEVNLGRIRHLSLPDDWSNHRQVLGQVGNSYLYYYGPEHEAELQFCIFYRGHLIDQIAGARFRELLGMPPHALNGAEIESLSDVLENRADGEAYKIESVVTDRIQQKPVLIVRGRFHHQNLEDMTIYVDDGLGGCAVQEIGLSAPAEIYQKYEPAVLSSLNTISWQDEN